MSAIVAASSTANASPPTPASAAGLSLLTLPFDLFGIILSYLPVRHKLRHARRLCRRLSRSFSPLVFRYDSLSVSTGNIAAFLLNDSAQPAVSILSLVRELHVNVGTPAIPRAELSLLLSSPSFFCFSALRLLRLQATVQQFNALLALFSSSSSLFSQLADLRVQSDALERGRAVPPLSALLDLPSLSAVSLCQYRIDQYSLSLLLSMPALTALSLHNSWYSKGALQLSSASSPLHSLSLPTTDSHNRDVDINAALTVLPDSLRRLRLSGALPSFALLSAAFPQLTSLNLSYCQFSPSFLSELTAAFSAQASLRHLAIDRYNLLLPVSVGPPHSPDKVTRYALASASVSTFLSMFAWSLRSLLLLLPPGVSWTEETSRALSAMRQLRSLSLSRSVLEMQPVTAARLRPLLPGAMPRLRSLSLQSLPIDADAVGVLLRAAPELRHLSCEHLPLDVSLVLIASAHCSRLCTLHIADCQVALTEEAFAAAEARCEHASSRFHHLSLLSLHLQPSARIDTVGLYRLVSLVPAVRLLALLSAHLTAHDVSLLSQLQRLRSLNLNAGQASNSGLRSCIRVYEQGGGAGRQYCTRWRGHDCWTEAAEREEEEEEGGEGQDSACWAEGRDAEWLREFPLQFVEEEVHSGLDGRAAFFHDLPLQLMHEREMEQARASLDRQRRQAEQARRDVLKLRRAASTALYRPPAALSHSS